MFRIMLAFPLALTLISTPVAVSFADVVAPQSEQKQESTAAGNYQAVNWDNLSKLPKAGSVRYSAHDVVDLLDLEAFIAFNEEAYIAPSADALKALTDKTVKFAQENMAPEAIETASVFLSVFDMKVYKTGGELSDEDGDKIFAAMEAAGYNMKAFNVKDLQKVKDFYFDVRAQAMGEVPEADPEALKSAALTLYNNMDVIGFMVFDQEGRSCAGDDALKEKLCSLIKERFLALMQDDAFKQDCEARAVDLLMKRLSPTEIDYAAAYHGVVDHKQVKVIVDKPDYQRDDLKAYMDGALVDLDKAGFDPANTDARHKAQRIRKDVMVMCAQIMGQHLNKGEAKDQN